MEQFREDINRYRFETDTTWTALAEKAGVSPAMFTRLKKGSVVTLEAFAQLCASCRLNPIDYMPELQTAQEHETAKKHPMEEDPSPAWSAEEDGRPQCAPEIMR